MLRTSRHTKIHVLPEDPDSGRELWPVPRWVPHQGSSDRTNEQLNILLQAKASEVCEVLPAGQKMYLTAFSRMFTEPHMTSFPLNILTHPLRMGNVAGGERPFQEHAC